MKSKDHIYVLKIDSSLDETLKRFQEQLDDDEQIIAQTFVPSGNSFNMNTMVITTRKVIKDTSAKPTNLLLEETKKRSKK